MHNLFFFFQSDVFTPDLLDVSTPDLLGVFYARVLFPRLPLPDVSTLAQFPRLIFSALLVFLCLVRLVSPHLPVPSVSMPAYFFHASHYLVSPRLTFSVFPHPLDISTPGLPSVSMPSIA